MEWIVPLLGMKRYLTGNEFFPNWENFGFFLMQILWY